MMPYLISVDWGTSRLRLRLVDTASADILATVVSSDGVAAVAAMGDEPPNSRAGRFASLLRTHVAALKGGYKADIGVDEAPVVVSGMAGSSIGWRELPYAHLPFPLDGSTLVIRDLGALSGGHRGAVTLISGVRSEDDVLRGEEVEAIGLAEAMGWSMESTLTLVLPGTHSKHLGIQDGRVKSFRTFLTGELFDVLGRHSVLKHSMAERDRGDREGTTPGPSFVAGVRVGAETPLSAALFRVRTRHILHGEGLDSNTEFLSGLLIGNEMSALRGTSGNVLVAAPNALGTRYRCAAETLGLKTIASPDVATMTRAVILAHRRVAVRSLQEAKMCVGQLGL